MEKKKKMARAMTAAGFVFLTALGAFCQTAAAPAEFVVASVKAAPPPTSMGFLRVQMKDGPGTVNYDNVSLLDVLTKAYASVKDHQIVGPDWLRSERYNIVAKIPPNTPKDRIPAMLQTLVADRFKMAVHRETKVLPVYALVAAKNGPKLHAADAEAGFRISMGPKGHHLNGKAPISGLVQALSRFMDRPVLDMTEIKGIFDIDLEWSPDPGERSPMMGLGGPGGGPRPEGGGEGKSAPDTVDAPTVFVALQEKLGLKLEARKSPVEIIVVDRAEKVPTEN